MKRILVLLILIISFNTLAQRDEAYVDEMVLEFTTSLKNRGVVNYFYSKQYCQGETQMFFLENGKTCASKGTYFEVYIFWEEEGKAMIKKIDNCGLYYSVELPNSDILDYFKEHKEALKTKTVKNYDTQEEATGPIQRTEIHPCYKTHTFLYNSSSFTQTYHEFDLTNDSENKNIHFDYNNNLPVVKLSNQCQKVIEQFTNQNKFRRFNRS